MRRLPIVATLVVLLAVGTMIGLGVWQLHRAEWKEALLYRYHAAEGGSVLKGLPAEVSIDRISFRRAEIACTVTTPATQLGGASAAGESGFRNIFGCRLADGRTLMADLGWHGVMARPALPAIDQRITGTGRLIPDDILARRVIGEGGHFVPLLFVLERGTAGLQPSVPPSVDTIPNNHRSYAVQWFLFAGVALIIFVLAVRRRARKG